MKQVPVNRVSIKLQEFLTHTVQMKLKEAKNKEKRIERILNPHGSDETQKSSKLTYFSFHNILNPHGSDETNASKAISKSLSLYS